MSNVAELDSNNFDKLVSNASNPVLVDFWASWCGPCKMMAPIIDDIAQEVTSLDVYKCDVDVNQKLAMKYNVSSIPTFILFRDGMAVKTIVGAMPKESLIAQLSPHLG